MKNMDQGPSEPLQKDHSRSKWRDVKRCDEQQRPDEEHVASRVRKRQEGEGVGRAQGRVGEWLLPGASRKEALTHDDANVASFGGFLHDCNLLGAPAAQLLY